MTVTSTRLAGDADDRIRQMMGDGSDSGLAARDAQSPFLQPRHEVGPGDRDGPTRSHRFTQCLLTVYIRFEIFNSGLQLVYLLFDSSLNKVWCRFTLGVLGLRLLPENSIKSCYPSQYN